MELFKLFGTIAIKNADANDAIDDTTDKAKDSENKISGAFKKIGTAVATYFAVDKIKDFGLNCISAAADAEAAASQFTQVFGDMEGQAKKSLTGIADDTGIQVNRMKGSYTQIAAFAKTTGMDTSSALSLADRAMVAVADSAAFYDRTLEATTESLQSFLKGNFENDAALGLSCTETTRNAAANKLYGQSFKDLSEDQKQLTLLQMVEDANAASGALGQAARESDTWTNQIGNLIQACADFHAVLGKKVLPTAVIAVKKAAEAVQGLSDKMPVIVQTFKDWSPLIAGVVTGLVTLKATIAISGLIDAATNAWKAYKTANEGATIAQWLLTAAMNANPIVLIVSLIAGLVAAIIVLWNTNEDFRNAVVSAWETIKETISTVIEVVKTVVTEKFNAVKETVINIFTSVKDALSEIWETIKNVIQVAILFIAELFNIAFTLITLPWQFIWQNCKEYIIAAWEAVKTVISNALEVISNKISTVWNAVSGFIKTVWEYIKSIISDRINEIKTVISNVLDVIKTVITTVLNHIKTVFANIWNAIKTKVSDVINSVKSIVSDGLNKIKSTASDILDSIKNTFVSVFDGIKKYLIPVIDWLKGIFNFTWELPKIKLPHFSISGKFSLKPPSVPHFSVAWYKKAMDEPYMFTKPTIFGVNPATGQPRGAGEAGDELMIGKDTMMNMIGQVVATQNKELIDVLLKILNAILSMDDDICETVRELLGGISLEIDKREFARLVKEVLQYA